jgi:hypothetical protein
VHLYDPHDSCEPPKPLPKTYDVEVAYADSVAGEFLGYLKKKGLYDNSVVIVVGDHGEGLESIHENRHAFDLYATQAINRSDGGLRGESIRYLRRYRLQDWLVAQGADRRKAHPLRMSITTSWLVRTGASPSFDDVRNERRCDPSATKQHGAFAAPWGNLSKHGVFGVGDGKVTRQQQ